MIGQRFSAAAATYDRHARPQQALAQSVIAMLPEIYPEQILELGAGTGWLTQLLVNHFPETPVDAVDIAEKMVTHSRERFYHYPQIKWIVGDAQTWRGDTLYPLIVSSAALHWTTDLQATYRNIFDNLQPRGCFVLGMMLRGTLRELHELRREIAPNKMPKLSLPTYDETAAALERAGFRIEYKKHCEEKVIYANANSFLKAIHEQGVTGGRISAGNAPLSRSEISQLIAEYQENCTIDDGVFATYETAAFLAFKK